MTPMAWLVKVLFMAALASSCSSYQAATVSATQELRSASAPQLICEPIICAAHEALRGSDYYDDAIVCGSNGIFYDSLCAFENAKCEDPGLELALFDSCSNSVATHTKKKTKSCDLQCADNWSPICASDGVTYRNPCRLEEAYCRDQSIGPVYYGECD